MADAPDHDDKTRTYIVLTKGTMVSHYRIIEKIGAGGMGEVYLAEDTKLKRRVALKFLPAQLITDPDAKARFTREAQAAAALDHPNIVTVYEVSEYHGRPFFAMQHVGGPSLRDFVHGKELSISKIINLAIQICEGLSQAHHKGVLHRDIKPSNIVIDVEGRPKLLDFGLAAVKGGEHLTKTGSTLGTVGYMSPEQAQGQEVDQRSDLFSFGVVLYEMITGRTPFARENDVATAQAIVSAAPEPLSKYRANVPDDLQRIVTKLLEKDPQLRYQSAEGIVPDLKKLIVTSTSYIAPAAPKPRTNKVLVGAVILLLAVIVAGAAYKLLVLERREVSGDKKMLAVLPFENLGAPEDEYFADGITDEITSRLAKLSGLGVISRTSAMQYKHTDKGLREIGKELGVDYVLEGTIHWDKTGDVDRVRIHPQLIEVANDVHLWADRYDAVINDVFEVQSSIAEKVAEALNVTLLETERRALSEQPTENTEAYDYYLRGLVYSARSQTEEDQRNAVQMFAKAVELDSGFTLAYADLSRTHVGMYWFYYDRTEERLAKAKQAVDKAFELSPDSPGAHRAMGWYYYHGLLDYDRALQHFRIALETLKDNSDLLLGIAAVQRRQGKLEEAVADFKKSLDIDPRSATNAYNLAESYVLLRNYIEAVPYLDRAIAISPDWHSPYTLKAKLYVRWLGSTGSAREVLEMAPRRPGLSTYRYRELVLASILLDVYDGDYQAALDQLSLMTSDAFESQFYFIPIFQLYAQLYGLMGRQELEHVFYDSACGLLETRIQAEPHDARFHSALGIAYAGLGRVQKATSAAEKAVELLPVSDEAYRGYFRAKDLAQVHAMVGETDAAIDGLEFLLSIPGDLSVPLLRLDPTWDPLRDHPRFQALLEKYATPEGSQ